MKYWILSCLSALILITLTVPEAYGQESCAELEIKWDRNTMNCIRRTINSGVVVRKAPHHLLIRQGDQGGVSVTLVLRVEKNLYPPFTAFVDIQQDRANPLVPGMEGSIHVKIYGEDTKIYGNTVSYQAVPGQCGQAKAGFVSIYPER